MTGTDVDRMMAECRAIVTDATNERERIRDSMDNPRDAYAREDWQRAYARDQVAQGIAYGISTGRAWPELMAAWADAGIATVVARVTNAGARTIGDAYDMARDLYREV